MYVFFVNKITFQEVFKIEQFSSELMLQLGIPTLERNIKTAIKQFQNNGYIKTLTKFHENQFFNQTFTRINKF